LAGKNRVIIQDLEEELTTSDLPYLKYAPVSSTDVEFFKIQNVVIG
jgi:hypothetical protein